jgi:hypothetical protein
MNRVPLGAISIGSRNRVRIDWLPEGDGHTATPVVEIARDRLGTESDWTYVGGITIRASNDLRELANALDTAARFAERWRLEHAGER